MLTATCHSIKPFKSSRMESWKKEEKKAAQQQQWCNKRVPIAYIQFNLPVLLLAWLLLLTVAIYTAPLSCYCVLTPKILIAQYLFSSSYYINSFFFLFSLSLRSFIPYLHLLFIPHVNPFLRSEEWGGISLEYFFLAIIRAKQESAELYITWKVRENARAIFLLFFRSSSSLFPFLFMNILKE